MPTFHWSARIPWMGFAGVVALQYLALLSLGRLTPVEVPDTLGYYQFPWHSLTAVLSHPRTPGYPLLLSLTASAFGSTAAIPTIQLLLFDAAALWLAVALRANGAGAWFSVLTAAAACGSNLVLGYVQTVATDVVAGALGIAAMAALLLVHRAPRRVHWWVLLSLTVAGGWLVRPAYLALATLVPAAGLALEVRRQRTAGSAVPLGPRFLALCLTVLLPLGGWCALRWCVVGRFGIVSFGGANLVAVAGQFLDEPVVAQLPRDLQPLARSALAKRAAIPRDEFVMPDAPPLNYQRMESNYDLFMWRIFVPAASELNEGDQVRMNTELQRLARAIIWLRPLNYAVWLAKAYRRALWKLIGDFVASPLGVVLVTVGAGMLLRQTMGIGPNGGFGASAGDRNAAAVLLILTVLYAATHTATTILVCPPLGRMTDAAGVLLPGLAMAAVFLLASAGRRSQIADVP